MESFKTICEVHVRIFCTKLDQRLLDYNVNFLRLGFPFKEKVRKTNAWLKFFDQFCKSWFYNDSVMLFDTLSLCCAVN